MKKAPYMVPQSKKVRVIIDTDCHCEADDQYAVAHQLMTPKFDVMGITAIHYANRFNGLSAADSMNRSFDEAQRIVDLMGLSGDVSVYRGCSEKLSDDISPVDSEASRFIIDEAMKDDPRPLFIAAQGAVTNIASALLMSPGIAGRMTIIWIGGGEYPVGGLEFNTMNDPIAANILMDSSVELWQVPRSVYCTMRVSFATLYDRVYPHGELGKYLYEHLVEYSSNLSVPPAIREQFARNGMSAAAVSASYPGGESWSLGDSPVVGLMLTDHEGQYKMEGAPRFEPESCNYILRPENPRKIRVYISIDSHFILEDFFAKLKYHFGE